MSSYQNFTEYIAGLIIMLSKILVIVVIFRCGLILLDINVFVPILDPIITWLGYHLFGIYISL